jgi:hypothetical protein
VRRNFEFAPHDVRGVESALRGLASRQSGAVARWQLVRLGLTAEAIKHRIGTGRLIVIYRGVYAVGHAALSDRGRIFAGLLAAGPSAVASHRTAAALYGLIPTLPAVVDVTVTGRARRSRPTLNIHETTRPMETRRRQGIPVTAPLRTLADLASTRPAAEVDRARSEALAAGLVRPEELDPGTAPTRSELENRMLALIAEAGLPAPLVNHPIGPYLVDFAWPAEAVVVETDGYATHGDRAAFERDRARDAALQAAGYVVLRFTWRQITREPLTVVARLAQVLARAENRTGRRRAA